MAEETTEQQGTWLTQDAFDRLTEELRRRGMSIEDPQAPTSVGARVQERWRRSHHSANRRGGHGGDDGRRLERRPEGDKG